MTNLRQRAVTAGLAAAVLMATASSASAQIIDSSAPIPLSEVIANFNNTGLDWVYAGPIAPNEFGPGNIQPASYRASEGWRVATIQEWLLHPTWSDFTRSGFSPPSPVAGFSDHSTYRFTSEYWSNFSHVDLSDFAAGRVTDGVNGVTSGVPETIYVRFSAISGAVPEPSTWALMLVGFGLLGGAMRSAKRRQMTTVSYA